VSVNLPSTTSSLIATEPTIRKSTSLEDVTNTGENSDLTSKLSIVIPDSIEVEVSNN
jgi:hypothetical protein